MLFVPAVATQQRCEEGISFPLKANLSTQANYQKKRRGMEQSRLFKAAIVRLAFLFPPQQKSPWLIEASWRLFVYCFASQRCAVYFSSALLAQASFELQFPRPSTVPAAGNVWSLLRRGSVQMSTAGPSSQES